jgi:uncharacterized protein YbjQ (UPF0145 family)
MVITDKSTVEGRKTKYIGEVYAARIALSNKGIEDEAKRLLEEQAQQKGADAIIGYRVLKRITDSGLNFLFSGKAVKLID